MAVFDVGAGVVCSGGVEVVVGSASLEDSEVGEEDDDDVVVLGVSVVSVISVVSTVSEVEVGVEAGVDVVVGGTDDDVVGVSWLVSFVSVGVGSGVSDPDSDADDWVGVVGSSDEVVGVSEEVVVGGVEGAGDSDEEEVVSFTELPCRTARRMMLFTILASLLWASPMTPPSVRLRGA